MPEYQQLYPDYVTDPRKVVMWLAVGLWSIREDDAFDADGRTTAEWCECVQAICDRFGVPVKFESDNVHKLTVAVNPDRVPKDDLLGKHIREVVARRERRQQAKK